MSTLQFIDAYALQFIDVYSKCQIMSEIHSTVAILSLHYLFLFSSHTSISSNELVDKAALIQFLIRHFADIDLKNDVMHVFC